MARELARLMQAMENVVRLADYRKRRMRGGNGRAPAAQEGAAQYYCLRCDADDFKLYASGMVHCSHCGSLMRNLLVNGTRAEDPAQQ